VVKHGVSFELSSTVFADPGLLTIPDLEHSPAEERWLSIGSASDGKILCVAYLWSESEPPITKVRLISARRAASTEIRQYEENQ
jgi:uncharacterized protein